MKVFSNSSLLKEITQCINDKRLIRIDRKDVIDAESILGFPVSLSENLLLMSYIVDLHDEGFVLVRISDVIDAYSLESDAFYERMCSEEGLHAKAYKQNVLKEVGNINDVLQQLMNYPEFISVSCDLLDNEMSFSIGKIIAIEDNFLRFKHFSPEGVWEEKDRLIPIEQITSVAFGDNYSKMYFKYMENV